MPTTPSTCGQGLAAHAPLPGLMGQLAAATASVLESHLPMLDTSDPASRAEHEIYTALVAAHRELADLSARLASRLASYRDLPMGRHTITPEANRAMAVAFRTFVETEESLAQLLQARLSDDRAMLEAMSG